MKGLTLTEVLIVIVLLAVTMLAVFAVMDVGRRAWFAGDVSTELRREIINVFTTMDRELKETRPAQQSLTSGSTSATLTFKVPQDRNGDGTVLDASGNIEWSDNMTYALNGDNEITRTVAGITPVTTVIARDIVNLQFSRPLSTINLLVIDIAAQKESQGRVAQDGGELKIKMRN
jgi:prepilin-type N-terminal cleavage/methylation domain-containing protein